MILYMITNEFPEFTLTKNTRSMDQICNVDKFETQKHQKFIGEYMQKNKLKSPRILLYHGLGSGKTCSSIVISQKIKHNKKTIVVVPASLQNNYRKELMSSCVSNNKYLSASDKKKIQGILKGKHICEVDKVAQSKYDNIIKKANTKIDKDYEIMSYQGFVSNSNKNNLNLHNRLVIIDEVQNIISLKGSMYQTFHKEFVHKKPRNMNLVLLSGTPMIDTADEIALVLNLLDTKDNQLPVGKEFHKTFIQYDENNNENDENNESEPIIINQHILYKAIKDKVSFFSGISPNAYPERKDVIVKCPMNMFQQMIYKKALGDLTGDNLKEFANKNIKIPFSKSFFISPRQASNVVYTNKKVGLKHRPKNLKASQIVSTKFEKAIDNIQKSNGPSFVYSNFVSACGIEDFALLLKQNSFDEVTPNMCPIGNKNRFAIFRTGQSEENNRLLAMFNSYKNKDGNVIKVMIGSPAMKEGVSLLRVRHVHLLDPYWNNSRTEQIIGRAIRFCSHKDVPLNERNVTVNHYVSTLPDSNEIGIDEYIHKIANVKKVTVHLFKQLLMKFAFDCDLFKNINDVYHCGFSNNIQNIQNLRNIDHFITFKDDKSTMLDKINKMKIAYDKVSKVDIYLYSKSLVNSKTTKNEAIDAKDKLIHILKSLSEHNITINTSFVSSSYKSYDDICVLKFHYGKKVGSRRRLASIPKKANLDRLLELKKAKKSTGTRGNPKTLGGCPLQRLPVNGYCTNPDFPFKRPNTKDVECCYKKRMHVKNISNLPLNKRINGTLLIGRKKCEQYKKQELIDFAKKRSIDFKGSKKLICKRIFEN